MDIQIIKKKELWIWLLIAVLAAGCFFVFQKFQTSGAEVVVKIGQEEKLRLPLNEKKNMEIEGKNGFTVQMEIKDGKVWVTKATCPDQICVNHGHVSKTMDSIVCLPAQIVIFVEQENETNFVDGIVK